MKVSRMSMRKQWYNIGRGAVRMGLKLEAVLTVNPGINRVIREGYEHEWKRLKTYEVTFTSTDNRMVEVILVQAVDQVKARTRALSVTNLKLDEFTYEIRRIDQ